MSVSSLSFSRIPVMRSSKCSKITDKMSLLVYKCLLGNYDYSFLEEFLYTISFINIRPPTKTYLFINGIMKYRDIL